MSENTTIRNSLLGGYHAYYAAYSTGFFGADHRPQWTPNPYSTNPAKDLWLRGWREAEKAFLFKGQYLQPKPFETAPGLRDAARYHEAKARGRARTRPQNIAGAVTGRVVSKSNFVEQEKPRFLNTKKLDRFNKKHRTVA